MTDVTPNPQARTTRLLARARMAHEAVGRLVADLYANEGLSSAMGAQSDLSELCLTLEGLLRERA